MIQHASRHAPPSASAVFVVENLQRTAHMDMLNNFKDPLFVPERVLEDRGVKVRVYV